MTEREAIEHLKVTVPRVQLTRWQKIARVLAGVFAGIAVMALTVSVYATVQAQQVGDCVNAVLAERSAPAARDASAHIDFAKALNALATAAPKTPAESAAVIATFKAQALIYQRVLVADQELRDAHPLGRC